MDGTAFDKDVFLAVDTVTDGGSDIEVEILNGDIRSGFDGMFGLADDIERAVSLQLKLPFAVFSKIKLPSVPPSIAKNKGFALSLPSHCPFNNATITRPPWENLGPTAGSSFPCFPPKMFFMFMSLCAFTRKSWQIGSKSCKEACLQAGFSGNLNMENCLDLAVRTEGIAGSVIPTIEQQSF